MMIIAICLNAMLILFGILPIRRYMSHVAKLRRAQAEGLKSLRIVDFPSNFDTLAQNSFNAVLAKRIDLNGNPIMIFPRNGRANRDPYSYLYRPIFRKTSIELLMDVPSGVNPLDVGFQAYVTTELNANTPLTYSLLTDHPAENVFTGYYFFPGDIEKLIAFARNSFFYTLFVFGLMPWMMIAAVSVFRLATYKAAGYVLLRGIDECHKGIVQLGTGLHESNDDRMIAVTQLATPTNSLDADTSLQQQKQEEVGIVCEMSDDRARHSLDQGLKAIDNYGAFNGQSNDSACSSNMPNAMVYSQIPSIPFDEKKQNQHNNTTVQSDSHGHNQKMPSLSFLSIMMDDKINAYAAVKCSVCQEPLVGSSFVVMDHITDTTSTHNTPVPSSAVNPSAIDSSAVDSGAVSTNSASSGAVPINANVLGVGAESLNSSFHNSSSVSMIHACCHSGIRSALKQTTTDWTQLLSSPNIHGFCFTLGHSNILLGFPKQNVLILGQCQLLGCSMAHVIAWSIVVITQFITVRPDVRIIQIVFVYAGYVAAWCLLQLAFVCGMGKKGISKYHVLHSSIEDATVPCSMNNGMPVVAVNPITVQPVATVNPITVQPVVPITTVNPITVQHVADVIHEFFIPIRRHMSCKNCLDDAINDSS